MKFVVAFLGLVAVATAIDHYPTKYDTIDIDNILGNRRLYNNHIACLMKKGICTEEGGLLREIIPDALITGCSKCNEIQKTKTEKVFKFLIKERRNDYDALVALYDPRGEYRHRYNHYLEKFQ